MSPAERVATLGGAHHRVVTRAQALDMGISTQMMRTRVRSGRWYERAPGVYVVAGSADTVMRSASDWPPSSAHGFTMCEAPESVDPCIGHAARHAKTCPAGFARSDHQVTTTPRLPR